VDRQDLEPRLSRGCEKSVAEPEGVVEDLPMIESRGVRRRQSGTPPAPASVEVTGRRAGGMAAAAVQDREDTSEAMMLPPECRQRQDEVLGVVGRRDRGLHPSCVDDQEGQDVDRPMPGILELLLLDRAGDRPAVEHLIVGHPKKLWLALIFGLIFFVGCGDHPKPVGDDDAPSDYNPQLETERRVQKINRDWDNYVKNNRSKILDGDRERQHLEEEFKKTALGRALEKDKN
jgi:hypothetical protein